MTPTERRLTKALLESDLDQEDLLKVAGLSLGYLQNRVVVARERGTYRVCVADSVGAYLGKTAREALATIERDYR